MPCDDLRQAMREACDRDPRGAECARLRRELQQCEQRARIDAALGAASRSLAARAAMEYADCRRGGGTIEECLGIFRAAPFPRPGCPVLQDELDVLPAPQRRDALLLLREVFVLQIKEIDRLLGRG